MTNLREELLKSYRHRRTAGTRCATCSDRDRPLAYGVLVMTIYSSGDRPEAFVPMSGPIERTYGSFPVCDRCAPPCGKCGLPIPTEKILDFGHSVGATSGQGICEHVQVGGALAALAKRALGLGRFSQKRSVTLSESDAPTEAPSTISNNDSKVVKVALKAEDLETVARERLPAANEDENGDFNKLLYELVSFGILTVQGVHELLDEHLEHILSEDRTIAERKLEQLTAFQNSEEYRNASELRQWLYECELERAQRGIDGSWSDLIRRALIARVGQFEFTECVKESRNSDNLYR